MSMQFVACTDEGCPFNSERQCRAPFIFVDEDGRCEIRNNGPYEDKSQIEGYVELRECKCSSCNFWKLDELDGIGTGKCDLCTDLSFEKTFSQYGIASDEPPKCFMFAKQINAPGFSATV